MVFHLKFNTDRVPGTYLLTVQQTMGTAPSLHSHYKLTLQLW